MTTPHKEITSGLKFPEGPVAMPDGSVILVEIARQTLTRVMPDGKQHVVAKLGGGPNGAAMGPKGKIYVTNNGGFNWIERPDGRHVPGHRAGRLQGRLDPGGRSRDRQVRDALQLVRRPQAERAQRPGVRRCRRLLVHRPRQDARARQRPRRRLLRQGRRLEDRGEDLPAGAAQRLRPLARRQDALRGRDADGALLGLRALGAGRDQVGQRPLSRREGPRDRGPRRLPDVQFAGRQFGGPYLRRHADHRRGVRHLARRQVGDAVQAARRRWSPTSASAARTCARPSPRCRSPASW